MFNKYCVDSYSTNYLSNGAGLTDIYYRDLFLLNIGFIIYETVGYSRDFPIEAPAVHLSPDLDLTDLHGNVRVTRTPQGLLLQGVFKAHTQAECGRCLTTFKQPLQAQFTELYAFTSSSATDTGLLVPESGKIDLQPIIRDEMLVSMPIRPVCRPDCKGLCQVCGENLNETDCHHEDDNIDPRFSILRELIPNSDKTPPSTSE